MKANPRRRECGHYWIVSPNQEGTAWAYGSEPENSIPVPSGTPLGPFAEPLFAELDLSEGVKADFINFKSYVLASSNAMSVITPFLSGDVQIVPVQVGNEAWQLINVLNVVNCFSSPEKDILRLGGTGRPILALTYSIDYTRVPPDISLFLDSLFVGMYTFCTEGFRAEILKHGLTGLKFTPVMDRSI